MIFAKFKKKLHLFLNVPKPKKCFKNGKMLILFALLFVYNSVSAQLRITTNRSVEDLVKNVLASKGVVIDTVTSSGNLNAIGYFDGRSSNIGLDSGIILSTGRVKNAAGANILGNTGTSNNQPGDDLITQLNPTEPNFDASWIKFKVTPESDTIKFTFVFASEEYPEFVNQSYNDMFGLFISGNEYPNPINFANIPNTTTPLSIQSVNHLVNSQYYVDNTSGTTCTFDGFTKKIEVKIKVTPCKKYELKFVIADIKDFIYDSGIFIEALSLKSINKNGVSLNANKEYFTECDSNEFIFTRNSDDLSTPINIKFKITGNAIINTDYITNYTDSILIPIGAKRAFLKIKPSTDGIAEPSETIMLKITSPYICDTISKAVLLLDYKKIDSLEFTYNCNDSTIRIGIRNYELMDSIGWYNSDNQLISIFPIAEINVRDTGYHYVRGVERCTGRIIIDSVKILNYKINIVGDTIVCFGDTLKLLATSNLSGAKYEWSTTTQGLYFPTPLTSSPSIVPKKDGEITVKITNDGICSQKTYWVKVIKLEVENDSISVCGLGNSAELKSSGGKKYKWTPSTFLNNDTIPNPICTPNSSMSYLVKIDNGDCSETFTVKVKVDTPITVEANPDIYICNRQFASLNAKGSPLNDYVWVPSTNLDSPFSSHPLANPVSTTTYYLIGRNGSCTSVDSTTIYVVNPIESDIIYTYDSCSKILNATEINATDSNEVVWNLGDGEYRYGKTISYRYNSGGNFEIKTYVNPSAPCIDSSSISIYIPDVDISKRRIPTAFSPNGDGVNDEFKVYFGNLPCAVESFTIYNRWGQQVYEHKTGDILSWDGKLDGQVCAPGIYVYHLKGQSFEDTGWFALIR